ncbi:hypothetical protein [Streptomyces ipomoeae]|nr:hypothetical protein [Streptomyces ipomoeae]MDX2938660.1 hypothetical protein [Streptomyces ipomoeae]
MSQPPPPFDPEPAAASEIMLDGLPRVFDTQRIRELRAVMGAGAPSDE